MIALDIGLQGRVISIFSYMKEILKYASIMNLVCLLTNFLFNPDDYERRQYLDP